MAVLSGSMSRFWWFTRTLVCVCQAFVCRSLSVQVMMVASQPTVYVFTPEACAYPVSRAWLAGLQAECPCKYRC